MHTMRSSVLSALAVIIGLVTTADAAPRKKYHYAIAAVTAKEVKPDLVKVVQPRVEGQVKKAFETHPQLVANLEGAPDAKTSKDAYRAYLAKKGLAGSYTVTVEITEATEEVVPVEGKPTTQRLVVHIALHMLGEKIPEMTMGFSGDGHATIKQEVGLKIRDKDREYSWDDCAKLAVEDAIKESLKQLELPPKKK